jgi:hypothetical protein
MLVNIPDKARSLTPNLRFGEHDLLGQMLGRDVWVAPAEKSNVDKNAIRIAEQQIGGAVDGTGRHLTPSLSAQRAFAAVLAISERLSGLKRLDRASPPLALFGEVAGFPTSSISPVAIRPTITARAMELAGRFCPCGPLALKTSKQMVSDNVDKTVTIVLSMFLVTPII